MADKQVDELIDYICSHGWDDHRGDMKRMAKEFLRKNEMAVVYYGSPKTIVLSTEERLERLEGRFKRIENLKFIKGFM